MEARNCMRTVQRRFARVVRASVSRGPYSAWGLSRPPCSRWPIRAFTMTDPGTPNGGFGGGS